MARRSALLPSLILAGMIALGSEVLWMLLVTLANEMWPHLFAGGMPMEQLAFLTDGMPIINHYEAHYGEWRNPSYRDLQGNSVSPPDAGQMAQALILGAAPP